MDILRTITDAARGCLLIGIVALCGFLLTAMYGFPGQVTPTGWSQRLETLKKSDKWSMDGAPRDIFLDIPINAANDMPNVSSKSLIDQDSQENEKKKEKPLPLEKETIKFKDTESTREDESIRQSKALAPVAKSIDDGPGDRTNTDIDALAKSLEKQLAAAVGVNKKSKPTCSKSTIANSCDKKCLQTQLPDDPKTRITQLVKPAKLQLTAEQHQILYDMAENVDGQYDVILLTAASSNHYLESQALLENIHKHVYPHLKNFTMVLYNLGLSERERAMMVRYCKCNVVDFPFDRFPDFLKVLKCYSWKPIMIKAHIRKANIVMWMDASIRFRNDYKKLKNMIQKARDRGVQIGGSAVIAPFRTLRSMYHFFGDEPCAFLHMGQAKATFGIYHREYFVERAVLEPWVACALNENCICPVDRPNSGCLKSKEMTQNYEFNDGPIIYGLCHRYDQSAISVILHKLYQESFRWVMVNIEDSLYIKREQTKNYFPVT